MLLFAGIASAQDEAPKAEVFGGYSYLRVNVGFGAPGTNFNGGSGSFSYNPNAWLGIVGDFGGYHTGNFVGVPVSANVISYVFGPKVAFRRGSVTPFVQALFGGAHASFSNSCALARVRPQGGIPCGSASENAFATALGGGVDWNATPHIGIRLVQAEYVMTRFFSETQNNVRVSTGVVFRW
jgi:opacity protein-like surface antigen